MNKLLIALLFLSAGLAPILVPGPAFGADEGFSSLEEQMTGQDFKAAGLDKLTPQELEALNGWIRRRSLATLDAPTAGAAAIAEGSSPADTRGLKGEKEEEDRTPISSRIVGRFSGWDGQTVFKLENGMIWAHAPVEFPAGALGPGAPRWVMAIAFPERVLLGQVLELSRLYLLLFVALALAAVAGYRLSRRLIGPLEALTSEVDAIAAGDLGRRVRVEGTDEIARLGERFNAMASRLQATLVQLQGQRDRLEIEVGERTRDLAAERARLAAVLRNASDAIAAVRSDGALLFANRAAERLLAPPREGSAQPMDAALAQLVGDGQPGRTEVTLGQRRLSVSRDRLAGVEAADERADVRADVVIVARDVTEERRLQDEKRDFDRQVAQMDKLATLGELAMGLAHEIGNPLAGMKAVVQSLLLDDSVTGEARDDLCRLESEIDRLTAFLGSFRGMAAPRLPVMTLQRLAVAVDDMLFWIRQPARAQGVEVSSNVEPDLPPLKADAAQLRQVLLNLLVNALHAMPDGGRLEVRGRAAGSMARIEVHDTGHGVPQNLQANIFKPFFSTRVKGSGLGLAVCAKLVDDHGGSIALESEPGNTTFTIHWPLIDSAKVPS